MSTRERDAIDEQLKRLVGEVGDPTDRKAPHNGYFGSVTDNALQRIALRGGCKRVSVDVYPTLRSCMSNLLTKLCTNADILSEHRQRTNIKAADVLYSLKSLNVPVHGTPIPRDE